MALVINPITEGPLGDLMESLVPVAADLIVAERDEGPDAIRGVLLRVQAIAEELPPGVAAKLDGPGGTPGGVWGAFAVVVGAMVNPETPLRSSLSWTESMRDGRRPRRGSEHPAERERQRLVAAGVPPEQALLLAAREVEREQDTARSRMLRAVRRGRAVAA